MVVSEIFSYQTQLKTNNYLNFLKMKRGNKIIMYSFNADLC